VALLLGGIGASGGLLQRAFGLPDAAVSVLQGLLFVVLLASETYQGRRHAPDGARSEATTHQSYRRCGGEQSISAAAHPDGARRR
jgi:ABC-type uncharacterized transport system permease subunit